MRREHAPASGREHAPGVRVPAGVLVPGVRVPVGLLIVAVFTLAALLGPWCAPFSPSQIDLLHEYRGPGGPHWLGTTDNGVDILSVLLHGARLAGVVGLLSVGASVCIGTLLGAYAGLRGGRVDHVVTGLADLVQAFPAIVLNIAIMALVAQPGVVHLVLALSANGWVLYARVVRSLALSLREREFVLAARALGASEARVLFRHVLPNVAGPLVVQATSGLGAAILAESTLSFLGLGPGKTASWGALLDQGSAVLLRFPHVALIAGGTIAVTVLGFNLAGDWLRDRLDPTG
ncbi:MAG: ABC transporter permease [Proteobacteria bacterium]|nr:ABC transporter permease [Pseudomonadota bacterium]